MKHSLLVIAILFFNTLCTWGKASSLELLSSDATLEKFVLYFYIDESDLKLPEFDNEQTIRHVMSLLKEAEQAKDPNLQVLIEGYTCPLGYGYRNKILSQGRVESLRNYMIDSLHLAPEIIQYAGYGVDWGRLRDHMKYSAYSDKNEFISIIDNYSVNDGRHRRLMDLNGGRTYLDLSKNYFPMLRAVYIDITYTKDLVTVPPAVVKEEEPAVVPVAIMEQFVEPVVEPVFVRPVQEEVEEEILSDDCMPCERYPLVNLKTNAIYWGALAPNIGLELMLPESRWSLHMDYFQPWWKRPEHHQYYQIIQYKLEPRFWLKDGGSYSGHFFGVYGNGGKYDLADGHYGALGTFWGAGISYGYAVPIRKHFAIEFSLSGGYLDTTYEKYKPIDTHYVYQQTKRTSYIGPTGIAVSLIWTPFLQKR